MVGEYGLYYDKEKFVEDDEEDPEHPDIRHTAPQHRQYLGNSLLCGRCNDDCLLQIIHLAMVPLPRERSRQSSTGPSRQQRRCMSTGTQHAHNRV